MLKLVDAQEILTNAIESVQNEVEQDEVYIPCFICEHESDMNNPDFYIDAYVLKIKGFICENCYDSIKYKVIDVMVETSH